MKNNNFSLKLKFCYDTLEIYRNSDFCFFFSISEALSLSFTSLVASLFLDRSLCSFGIWMCVCVVVFFIHFKYSAFAISIWMFFNQISIQTHIDRILHIPSIHIDDGIKHIESIHNIDSRQRSQIVWTSNEHVCDIEIMQMKKSEKRKTKSQGKWQRKRRTRTSGRKRRGQKMRLKISNITSIWSD